MFKKRNYIVGTIFILIITAIPALTLAKMLKNRIPIKEYTGALVGRFKLINMNTELTKMVSGGSYMESSEVLLGKEGWLFYKTKTDGEPLFDYMGINRFSENEMEEILTHMEGFGNYLKGRGIKFAVMTAPNKEQVYSEYMPDTILKYEENSRLDALTGFITDKNQGLIGGRYPYIDTSDVLKNSAKAYQLYYKTDSHWNEQGSFIAFMKLYEALYDREQSREEVSFEESNGFIGDLAKISGTPEKFIDVTYSLVEDSVDKSLKRDETLLIVGDSFGDSMLHTARHYYKNVYWVRVYDYDNKLIDEYLPDVVVWECVERYLPDFRDYQPGIR